LEVRFEELPETTLVGKSIRMSLANNRTFELWQSFMTDKSAIENAIGTALYSIQVYDKPLNFEKFNLNTEFTKWAAIEVEDPINIPNGFSSYMLKKGLYAVFIYKGTADEFPKAFQYILGQWLPQSEYELDSKKKLSWYYI